MALSAAGNTKGNKSKKGYYKGMYCGSSYELAYVIYNLDHNIPFARCDRYYEYEYNGSKHLYFPDFELADGTIIEIKGYHTETVDIKAAAVCDRPIKVLYKKDLSKYMKIESVIEKLSKFADKIGLAFQIKDDILGIYGSVKNIGKSNTSDITEYKQTILYSYVVNNKVSHEFTIEPKEIEFG